MEHICRLCLSYSPQNTSISLNNCEILEKINTCCVLEIFYNQDFPNKICGLCFKQLENFLEFYSKVSMNQKVLKNLLNKGKEELETFYISLKSNSFENEVKEIFLIENKENDNINVLPTSANIDVNKIGFKQEIKNNVSETEYSSDDDVTLSSIKEAEKISKTIKTKEVWKKKMINNFSKTQTKVHKAKVETNSKKTDSDNQNVTTEYKCLTCLSVLNSQNDLLKHYNTEHSIKNYKVAQNSINYDTLMNDNGGETFKCKKCEKEYENKRGITRHMITHVDCRPFICKLCGRTYKTVSEIIRHGRAHNGIKINCSFMCGYSTVYMGALKEHERRHTTESKYKCDKCNKGFQVKTWYLEHQNVHNGLKPFVCDICGLAFHMNRYLTAHKSSVHPQSSNLKRYICVHCSLPCDSRKALTEHYKEHGIKSSYLCDLCGKTLSNSEQLKIHRRMHLGIKPYSCGICSKSFAKKFNLTLHERTHTCAKNYECVRCGKSYTQRSTLRRHFLRNHAEEEKCQLTNVTTRNYDKH